MANQDTFLANSDLKLGNSFREKDGCTFFSIAEFVQVNQLEDDPEFQTVALAVLRLLFPDVRIVEEEN